MHKTTWTDRRIQTLIKMHGEYTNEIIAESLGVTKAAVRSQITKLRKKKLLQ